MMHLAAYTSSISNSATPQQVTALADGIVPTRDNAVVVPPQMPLLIAAFSFGTNNTRAYFSPPSRRRIGNYEIRPVANAQAAGGAQTPMVAIYQDAVKLDGNEELPLYETQSSAGAQQAYGAALFSDKSPVDYQHDIMSVHATGATTLVANGWTACPLTFDVGLPIGKFYVVGARVRSAGALLFRFVHQEYPFRPGGVAHQSDLALDIPYQRRGGLGVWFTFDYLTPPSIEVLSTSADTSEDFVLDIVPV